MVSGNALTYSNENLCPNYRPAVIRTFFSKMNLNYTAKDLVRELPTEEYIRRFRDAERIGGYCRACPNFGKSWGCPPFDRDVEAEMRQYRHAMIIATILRPEDIDLPFGEVRRMILPERRRLEQKLLGMEQRYGGRSYAYIGSCLYCPEGTCTRLEGKPCRHPDKVRPSLEACGFDIARTTAELFDRKLKWSKDGKAPEYLMLVCGFFHNNDNAQWNE